MKYIFNLLKIILILAIGAYVVAFYYSDKLIGIDSGISAATFKDPVQTKLKPTYIKNFKNGNYDYVVSSVVDYKISGIVVSKMDYKPADNSAEKIVRYDLCMVWGDNVMDKTYMSPNISYSQSQRFCTYSFSNGASLNTMQISNNHIVTANEAVLEKLKSIKLGDEISITGQLVNMSATGAANENSDIKTQTWTTSVDWTDTGLDASEVIYVDSIDILAPAHKVGTEVSTYALWAIAGITGFFVLKFMLTILFLRPKNNNGFVN